MLYLIWLIKLFHDPFIYKISSTLWNKIHQRKSASNQVIEKVSLKRFYYKLSPFFSPSYIYLSFSSLPLYLYKRDSKLEEHYGVYRFYDRIKSQLFIVIGWGPSIKIGVDYLSCIEGNWGLKDIHCIAQNAELFVNLL